MFIIYHHAGSRRAGIVNQTQVLLANDSTTVLPNTVQQHNILQPLNANTVESTRL